MHASRSCPSVSRGRLAERRKSENHRTASRLRGEGPGPYSFGSLGPLRVLMAFTHSSTCAGAAGGRRAGAGGGGGRGGRRAAGGGGGGGARAEGRGAGGGRA